MRSKMIPHNPHLRLNRILRALEPELVAATDQEIVEIAHALGMNLDCRQSAAFAGLTYGAAPTLADFFDLTGSPRQTIEQLRTWLDVPPPGNEPSKR